MKTILIVDDSPSIRKMILVALKDTGYELVEAIDGNDALIKAKSKRFDCVLTDLNMPNKDGISLIRDLRALGTYQQTPLLLITTESSPDKMQNAKAAGATGWIVKPFTREQLLETLSKVIK